jgi:hypothetical protein
MVDILPAQAFAFANAEKWRNAGKETCKYQEDLFRDAVLDLGLKLASSKITISNLIATSRRSTQNNWKLA